MLIDGILVSIFLPLSQISSQSLDGQHSQLWCQQEQQQQCQPPPPPTLEQVLIMQAQMLQTMQETMANMQ
jgi:hypothetical protein